MLRIVHRIAVLSLLVALCGSAEAANFTGRSVHKLSADSVALARQLSLAVNNALLAHDRTISLAEGVLFRRVTQGNAVIVERSPLLDTSPEVSGVIFATHSQALVRPTRFTFSESISGTNGAFNGLTGAFSASGIGSRSGFAAGPISGQFTGTLSGVNGLSSTANTPFQLLVSGSGITVGDVLISENAVLTTVVAGALPLNLVATPSYAINNQGFGAGNFALPRPPVVGGGAGLGGGGMFIGSSSSSFSSDNSLSSSPRGSPNGGVAGFIPFVMPNPINVNATYTTQPR